MDTGYRGIAGKGYNAGQVVQIYRAACYCRLSDDDDQDGTSVSIETQIKVLGDYCAEHGITIFDYYKDDGFTGTNFNRPNFQRMIRDAESGLINTVIVKDLSRFARNYIGCGNYISEVFPRLGVRFIAVNDNVDSGKGNLDYDMMIPLKNVFNEWYPADCSRKVKQAFVTKASAGEFLGSQAPYGYKKSTEDKHMLEIDDETAPHVKWMFEMAAYHAYGYDRLAKELKQRKIPCPTAYLAQKTGKHYDGDPYLWNRVTIYRLLGNETYLGHLISGKRRKLSYKSKMIVHQPESEWIVVKDRFPQLISDELWEDAHNALKSRKREPRCGKENVFSGLLKCPDCGGGMGIGGGSERNRFFACNTYKRKGEEYCSCHYILYRELYAAVLSEIQNILACVRDNKEEFLAMVTKKIEERSSDIKIDQNLSQSSLERIIETCQSRFEHLYEDRLNGLLSEKKFKELSAKCEAEQAEAEEQLSQIKQQNSEKKSQQENVARYLSMVDEYESVSKLDKELLNRLIEKIEVQSRVDNGVNKSQTIIIYFKVIGTVKRNVKET